MDQDPQSSVQQFHWQPNKKLLVLVFFLFPLLILLGFWQLDRADEKSAIVAAFSANQQAVPADVNTLLAVTYTHLTLPTTSYVEISVVAVPFKKKKRFCIVKSGV